MTILRCALLSIVGLATSFAWATQDPSCSELPASLRSIARGSVKVVKVSDTYIGIYHRTLAQQSALRSLLKFDGRESVPNWWKDMPIAKGKWAQEGLRSREAEWFVYWDASPIFGCNLLLATPASAQPGGEFSFLDDNWEGGFFEPCYGVGYDHAGYPRFHATGLPKNVKPNIQNRLPVPPYKIDGDHVVLYCE